MSQVTQSCQVCQLSKYGSHFPLRVPVCGMCFAHLALDAVKLLQRAQDESRCDHAAPPCSWCELVEVLLEKAKAVRS